MSSSTQLYTTAVLVRKTTVTLLLQIVTQVLKDFFRPAQNKEGVRIRETEKQTQQLGSCLVKYPPVLLVLVGDGHHHGFSSSPHPLPSGVAAEQGKACQLILTGTAETWKVEKKAKKGLNSHNYLPSTW